MNIFAIIFLSLLIGALIGLLYALVTCDSYWDYHPIIALIIGLVVAIGGTFIGIGILTNEERAYIAKYEAQKHTIEASLQSDTLSGFERAQLVTQAATLNGELAEKKARIGRWSYVTYDDHMYDGIEFIELN